MRSGSASHRIDVLRAYYAWRVLCEISDGCLCSDASSLRQRKLKATILRTQNILRVWSREVFSKQNNYQI